MAFKSYSQNFTKSYQAVFEKNHFTKILSAKPPKMPFNFDSNKKFFWVHKVSGIKTLFPNFHKTLCSGFWKKAHFTSPPLWKFLSPTVTAKPKKKTFNFESIQNSFWVHKVTGIRMLFTRFHKNYRAVFKKSSLYFTSLMKISQSRSNNKTPQIHLNLIQSNISFGYI